MSTGPPRLIDRRHFGGSLAAGAAALTLGCADEPIPSAADGGSGAFAYREMPPLMAAGWINGHMSAELARGHVQVVDCFASWCGPCAQQAPHLVQLYLKYRYNGVRFWGMTREGESSLDAVEKFVERYHTDWPIAYGAGPMMDSLNVPYIPRVFVVGKDNWIRWDSQQSSSSMERAIRDALAEPEAARQPS